MPVIGGFRCRRMTDTKYKIAEIGPTGKRQLVLKGPWNPSIASIMLSENIRALSISGYTGWNENNLDFLRDLPFLERLSLIVLNKVNIDGIYLLPNLKDLSVGHNRKPIDFTRFQHLERLSVGWSIGYESLFKCKTLRDIAIARLPQSHIPCLSRLVNLETLALSFCRFVDLHQFPELHKLTRLSLLVCNSLQRLGGIESCSNLLVLWVEQAKSLGDISAVAALRNLKTLVLRDCPQISSIRPLIGMEHLEAVAFSATTDICDGDLSPLTSLPLLRNADFKDRRHYSRRNDEFPKELPIFL
jgi:Leucine-rich repeat (LRR) protein